MSLIYILLQQKVREDIVGEGHTLLLLTHSFMFPVILPLMIYRTVLHQLAFTASQTSDSHRRRLPAIHTALRSLAALIRKHRSFIETYIAVDPIAHLLRFYLLPIPTPPFNRENNRTLQTPSWEADHLAIFRTARVRTTIRKVVEYFLRWNKERMCEENLGIRGRLMGEQNDKWWSFLL